MVKVQHLSDLPGVILTWEFFYLGIYFFRTLEIGACVVIDYGSWPIAVYYIVHILT